LDINGTVILGRDENEPGLIDLRQFGMEEGVSRQHALLRPTSSNLYILDLGSTNGTFLNGHSVGINTPHIITNGDTISLGNLQMTVRIIERPKTRTGTLQAKADLADALTHIAKTITSQLDIDEVLNQVVGMSMSLTSARETSVWLLDAQTGDLILEAQRGIQDEQAKHLRHPAADALVSKVLETGQPQRVNRAVDGDQIKVRTGYLVEALVYVPLKLGDTTFGVLAAAHREPGRMFSPRDEELLTTIANFAAIAIHSAHLYRLASRTLMTMPKTYMVQSNLYRADLFGASLKGANLDGADLRGADLRGADLQEAWLVGTNLGKADLRLANLHKAYLTAADLDSADLYNTNLNDANLYAASLKGVRLDEQQLIHVSALRSATMPDGSRYDGRYNLPDEVRDADRDGIDREDAAALAQWYGVSVSDYQLGQEWARSHLSLIPGTARPAPTDKPA
jgi:GAF domain-containing protein